MDKFGAAVILAGGKSERMGFDKQFLEINEKKLMKIIIDKLRKEFSEIIVITNKPEAYVDLCDKVLRDEIKGFGPLSGIHVGLKNSSSKYSYFIACDMPSINLEYIKFMKNKLLNEEFDVCVARYREWIEPFNAFYSKDVIPNIEQQFSNNQKSVFSFIHKLKTLYIPENAARNFSPDWEMFCNLNTREDLENYLESIKAQ
jgi:molybdenum cofactor guanylyltransferase